ncbi:glycosyltransferase family 2 protein [Methylomonas sp. 11b]|uniref:glycosyltransferase family 2 protein n=2 Tax=unclassified Methylomonas TaxID=2608980 RepID=UPI0004B19812|nr:glycosyltransferase [Methylomonas sp. 11b]
MAKVVGDNANMAQSLAPSPVISAIMAVYNTERYLTEAIQSILSQSFTDFELVIVDDGSTDGSPEILRNLAQQDSRIKLITQVNAGIGAATQRGIVESQGEYIAIMDSDDISLPDRLKLQKQFLDQHPDIDAVGSQWRMLHADGRDIGIDTHPTDSERISVLMYAFFSLHHPTTMIRRHALEKVGGYSVDRSCLVPDYDLFMRMQLAGCRFANLPEILFIWRLNPASTTHHKACAQAASVADVRDTGFKQLLLNDPQRAETIAKSIVQSFPTGTWQDERIRQLLPEREPSLLYRTWLNLPDDTQEDRLNKALVLWLKKPDQCCESLREQLIANNKPWLATLVDAYRGYKRVDPALYCDKLAIRPDDQIAVSLFVTYSSANEDFNQRLHQALTLKAKAKFPIEIIVVSITPDCSLKPFAQLLSMHECIFDDGGLAWHTAIHTASGAYFAYLEDNFRFNLDVLLETLDSQIQHKTRISFMADTRYFTDALDENDQPALDNRFRPVWTRSTLLGKDRVRLSNFIHHRGLLNNFNGNLNEIGLAAGRLLGRYLAIKNEFNIIDGAVNYFIPAIALNSNPLPLFQQTIGDWYLDYGMTNFPDLVFHDNLSKSKIEHYAQTLSTAWLNKNLHVYPGNASTLESFYLNRVNLAIRIPLFRYLLAHNKKTYLLTFWRNKAYLNAALALFYCVYQAIVIRFFSPHKK